MRSVLLAATLAATLATPALADPVQTFRALCMTHLDDVAALRAAAKRSGFALTEIDKSSFMGMRRATDESIQVNVFTRAAFECAVTTSDVKDPEALRARFFQSLGVQTRKSEMRVTIGGTPFTLRHDTRGGEALVIFR